MMKNLCKALLLCALLSAAILLLPGPAALAQTVGSGSIGADGDNVTWTLDDTGLLTISGEGAIKNFYQYNAPFSGMEGVRTAVIENGVSHIGNYLFSECAELTDVAIAGSVESVGNYAFNKCGLLKTAPLPTGVRSLGYYAFYQCASLESLSIPEGVTVIEASLCNDCTALAELSLPSTVESIGNGAFYRCTSLTGTLPLPAELKTIGDRAFYQCGFEEVDFPTGVTAIGSSAFGNNQSLTALSFPAALDGACTIADNAFFSAHDLTAVALPEGVTDIGAQAFRFCSNLQSVTLPASLTGVGKSAFEYCTSLSALSFPAALNGECVIGESAFNSCGALTAVALPEGVMELGTSAFRFCNGLTRVDLPASLLLIRNEALYGNYMLNRNLKLILRGGTTAVSGELFNTSTAFTGTICCVQGSTVEVWARRNGYAFRYIDPVTGLETEGEVATDYRELWLPLGGERELRAEFSDQLGGTVVWTSWSPDIVAVATSPEDNSVVVLTGLAPGVGHVTFTRPNTYTVTDIEVTVYRPVDSFSVAETLWMFPADSVQLEIENVLPEGAEGDFAWSSSDASVAAVDQNGTVTGHSPGEATISVRNGDLVKTTTVHVHEPLDELRFDFEVMAMKQGRKTQLFSDLPWLEEHSVNRLVVFSCADDSVASVDRLGWVTGVSRGMTTVRVTAFNDPNVYAEAAVVVLSAEPGILSLPSELHSVETGAFAGLTKAEAVLLPEDCASVGAGAFDGCTELLLAVLPGEIEIAGSAFDNCGEWIFICPQGEEQPSQAAAYAKAKGMRSFETILWIADEDTIPA